MKNFSHPWNVSTREAIEIQRRLAGQTVKKSTLKKVAFVAGIDTGYCEGFTRAAVVVLNYPELKLVHSVTATLPTNYPYVPGLLTFREGPAIIEAWGKLKIRPDLLIFDGHGLAHPRRCGIASHIGILLDIPSIGCAKTRLCGTYAEPDTERGKFAFLTYQREVVGAVLRTRSNVKPVFVSIGHKIDLEDSMSFVLKCCQGFRLPQTTRYADRQTRHREVQDTPVKYP